MAERMATEHQEDSPIPGASSLEGAPKTEVESRTVTYATVEGQEIQGYLARPRNAAGPLAGIIVIQEWWGLNDNIRKMADLLAGEGYTALAVDLYNGQVADHAFANPSGTHYDREAAQDAWDKTLAFLVKHLKG